MMSPSMSMTGTRGAITGGETREDGLVSFGYSLLKGKRPNMEDYHHAEVGEGFHSLLWSALVEILLPVPSSRRTRRPERSWVSSASSMVGVHRDSMIRDTPHELCHRAWGTQRGRLCHKEPVQQPNEA